MRLFDDKFDYREMVNHKELTDYAVALFVGMMSVPAVPSGGGGGTSNDLPWGRKEDEDEMERFLADRNGGCPYYQSDDEYQVVKHQM